jgi:hypothetical protein
MERNEVIKIVSGITLIFFTVAEIFAVLTMAIPFVFGGTIGDDLSALVSYVWPQLVVIAAIISLFVYTKKQKWSIGNLLHDQNIRLAAGTLLILDGFVDLFYRIPPLLSIINGYFHNPEPISLSNSLTFNIISLSTANIFILSQIAVGIYLFKRCNSKMNNNLDILDEKYEALKKAIGIALLFFLVTDIRTVLVKVYSRFIHSDHGSMLLFARYDLPGLAAAAVIIGILFMLAKKQRWSSKEFLQDQVIGMTAGTLIILDGMINLFICLSGLIYIISLYADLQQNAEFANIRMLSILASVVNAVFILYQIAIGAYFVKHSRRYQDKSLTGIK